MLEDEERHGSKSLGLFITTKNITKKKQLAPGQLKIVEKGKTELIQIMVRLDLTPITILNSGVTA